MPVNNDELALEGFLAAQMKNKGFSVKKLSEATGVAPAHIENMLRGDFEELPSAPYLRGYLVRIGKTLGFDGEEWWAKLKSGSVAHDSGPSDVLPRNRFVRKEAPKWLWLSIAAGVLIVAYLAFALPRILGRPSLAVIYPPASPFVATSTTFTFQGTAHNADGLSLSSGGAGVGGSAGNGAAGATPSVSASASEEIPIAPDGTWQKTVLLQNGLNTFEFAAKKFLGGEADVVEQVIYGSAASAGAATGTPPSATSAPAAF